MIAMVGTGVTDMLGVGSGAGSGSGSVSTSIEVSSGVL